MNTSANAERTWLNELEAASLVGITYVDTDGRHIQIYNDDPALRIMLIDYQKERVRLLELDERSLASERQRPTSTD